MSECACINRVHLDPLADVSAMGAKELKDAPQAPYFVCRPLRLAESMCDQVEQDGIDEIRLLVSLFWVNYIMDKLVFRVELASSCACTCAKRATALS